MIKKNDIIEVNITDYGTNGEGVAKVDGFTIFINGAIKGEKCKIIITKVLKTHGFGKVTKIIEESDKRVKIDCKTYPRCGGCSLRHINYTETLNIKKEKVQNLITRNVDKNLKVNDCIGMDNPFYYRNKAIYPVTYAEKIKLDNKEPNEVFLENTNKKSERINNKINEQRKLNSDVTIKYKEPNDYMFIKPGIYAKRSHIVVPFEECKIQTINSQKIAEYICNNWKSTIYNEENDNKLQNKYNQNCNKDANNDFSSINNTDKNENLKSNPGILRNIMIREGFETGEILVTIVESKFEKNAIDVQKLVKEFPNIKTVVANINSKNTNVVLSNENIVLYGDGFIYDKIGEYTFKISPNSFYQVNPAQTKVIYETAIKEANLNKNDVLCDLYSGIGTIGIFASKYVKKVYGIEIVSDAIKDARENAKINNINNIEFIEGDVEKAFDKLLRDFKQKKGDNFEQAEDKKQGKSNKNTVEKETIETTNNNKENLMPNAVIVDPPRKGLDEKTIQNLCMLNLEKLVYVSCNPATLARDLSTLKSKYNIKSITPIDNFPYSSHVETVVTMTKNISNKIYI